jgi:signal transduction histidine kinase
MKQSVQSVLRQLTLAQRFGLASLIILILGLIGIGFWVQREIAAGIIHGTASTTALYVESFVEPQLGELAQGLPVSPQHLQTLANLLHDTPLGKQIVAFKLWGPNGFVLYDTDQSSIGKTFPVEQRLAQAWGGQTTSRVSSLDSDENVGERPLAKQLLETYSPVHAAGSDRIIAVAEFYQRVDELQNDIAVAQRLSWLVVAAAMLMIYLFLSGFVRRAGATIQGQQTELTAQVAQLKALLAQNEELSARVQRSAARTTAINERFLRRIGAELHDGPAQDLSLALLRLDPGTGDDNTHPMGTNDGGCVAKMAPIRDAVSHALSEIRGISGGLALPELKRLTLADTIGRAVRGHERRTGSAVNVHLDGLPDQAPLAVKITAYRVVQEALNNAYRHAGGRGQTVRADAHDGQLYLEVCDDGPGFDAETAFEGDEHLGLLGMRERVQSQAGTFDVESGPGRGTRVRACLALRVAEGL